MALLDEDQQKVMLGVGIGMVVLGVIRGVAPGFRGAGRPLAVAAIKGSITLYEKGREKAAQFAELFEDLVAEAKAELGAAPQAGGPGGPAAGGGPEGNTFQ